MAYSTNAYPPLAEKITLGVASVDVDNAIEAADGEINSALRDRYPVPIVSTDEEILEVLKFISGSIACYNVSAGSAGSGRVTLKNWNRALVLLEDYRTGKKTFPGLALASALTEGISVVGKIKTKCSHAGH